MTFKYIDSYIHIIKMLLIKLNDLQISLIGPYRF